MKTRKFFYLFLFFLSVVCSFSFVFSKTKKERIGLYFRNEKKITEIPFQLHGKLIIFPISINDGEKLNFILDTGVRSIFLYTKNFKNARKFKKGRQVKFAGIGNKKFSYGFVTHNLKVKVGDVEGTGLSAVLINKKPKLFRGITNKKIHGIMGYQLFSRFIVKINYKKRILYLMEPSVFIPDRSYKSIPMIISNTKPYVYSHLNISEILQVRGRLLVDLGTNSNLIIGIKDIKNSNIARDVPLQNIGKGMTGSFKGRVGEIKVIRFGNLVFENINTTFVSSSWFKDKGNDKDKMYQRIGSLGAGILSQFNIILDYFNEKLYIENQNDLITRAGYQYISLEQ